jgi:gamma-glutamylputrescine oxidase
MQSRTRFFVMPAQLAGGAVGWQGRAASSEPSGEERKIASEPSGEEQERTVSPLDDIDENRSIWVIGKEPYEPLAALAADETVDVAIVGGGFTGVSTALHLARRYPDRRIVLCEARSLANGASGRNGGLMLNWINGVYSPDAEHARRIFDVTKGGIDLVRGIIADEKLEVRHDADGCLEVFTTQKRAEEAHRHVESMRSAGVPLEYLDADATAKKLRLEGAAGAVLDPTAGHLDGVDFLRALRPRLVALGVGVYEGTPVLRIDEGETVRIETPGGVLSAKAVVLATNAYTPRLGYFRREIMPLHSHVVATEALAADRWREVGWRATRGFSDDLDRIAYGCLTTRGELVFGGGSNAAYSYRFGSRPSFDGEPESKFRAVERCLHRYLPALAEVPIACRWTGPVAITMSRCFAVGVRGEHRNVYYAFGYSGHGVVLANLAGQILCDIYSDDDNRWRDMPFYQPKMFRIPPEPFRWVGYHVYTTLTGRSPRKSH